MGLSAGICFTENFSKLILSAGHFSLLLLETIITGQQIDGQKAKIGSRIELFLGQSQAKMEHCVHCSCGMQIGQNNCNVRTPTIGVIGGGIALKNYFIFRKF